MTTSIARWTSIALIAALSQCASYDSGAPKVVAVYGFHEGRCSAARVAEVQRELQALPSEINWRMGLQWEVRSDGEFVRLADAGPDSVNGIRIVFATPGPTTLTLADTTEIFAETVVAEPSTELIYRRDPLFTRTTYTQYGTGHDVFHMALPKSECAVYRDVARKPLPVIKVESAHHGECPPASRRIFGERAARLLAQTLPYWPYKCMSFTEDQLLQGACSSPQHLKIPTTVLITLTDEQTVRFVQHGGQMVSVHFRKFGALWEAQTRNDALLIDTDAFPRALPPA